MNKQFTTDWFSSNIETWEIALQNLKGKPNLNFLEVGCWEGKATCWLLENILTDKSSKITVVDTFEGSPEEDGMNGLDFKNVYSRFKHNIKEYDNKVTIHNGYSSHMLKQLGNEPLFDFAYIDASHTAYGTLEDAILVHPLIKNGGIIIFDDYKWKDPKRPSITDSPELGINCFANAYADFYGVLFVGYQIGLVKVGNIK
jgi:hypothetical protein